MDGAISKYEESDTFPVADTEGKDLGDDGSGASSIAGLQNSDALKPSGCQDNEQQQHEPAYPPEDKELSVSGPPSSQSILSKDAKPLALPAMDHSVGQGYQTATAVPGMLPPLSIRGETGRERRESKQRKSTISFKTAATTVMSAGTMRNFRRSSAAMHVDLLRVFVPDMLIDVSAMDIGKHPLDPAIYTCCLLLVAGVSAVDTFCLRLAM